MPRDELLQVLAEVWIRLGQLELHAASLPEGGEAQRDAVFRIMGIRRSLSNLDALLRKEAEDA